MNLQQILACLHERCDIHTEGIISIGPVARLMTIEENRGFCHRTIEHEFSVLTVCRDLDGPFVVSFTNPRQGTRTATLLGSLFLTILFDGHHLQVPFLIEWSGDGPVVGHRHDFPCLLVVRKTPVVAEGDLLSWLCERP